MGVSECGGKLGSRETIDGVFFDNLTRGYIGLKIKQCGKKIVCEFNSYQWVIPHLHTIISFIGIFLSSILCDNLDE